MEATLAQITGLRPDLTAALTGLLAYGLAVLWLRRRFAGPPRREFLRWAWLAPLAAVMAGRIGHLLAHRDVYAARPSSALALWDGGLALQPAILVAVLVTAWAAGRATGLGRAAVLAGAVGIASWQGLVLSFGSEAQPPLAGRFETLDGAGFTLEDHLGRPVVMNLWATWCAPCRRELPMMAEVAEATSDITFAFVNQRESPQRVALYLATEGIRLPNVVFDDQGALARHYTSFGLPATVFLDASGRVQGLHVGEISREELRARIDALRAPFAAQRAQ